MVKSAGPNVTTKNGRVEGIQQDSLYVFKGLTYAAPPTGERRWLAPQPVEGWKGVRLAKPYGPA